MSLFERIVYLLQADMETPASYGGWHICFLLLTIAASILAARRFRNVSDTVLRKALLAVWIVLVASEAYKQLVYSMDVSEGQASWSYQWYTFPFQFCSTPLYALPFVIWMRDCRVRNAVMAFLATFSLFAGVAVMLYPGDVFISMIGINIQTMVHHGCQIVLGVLMVAYCRHRIDRRFFVGSVAVFAVFATVAMLLNLSVHAALSSVGRGDTVFNMFFISPYHPCTLPVLSAVDPLVPYPVFLLTYLMGFSGVSAVIFGIEKGIVTLISRHKPLRK